MRTIAVAMQKGGSGKSTLAIGLAVAAMLDGERVAILETDPQGTVSNWGVRRATAEPAVARVAYAIQLERALRSLAADGRTLAIVDTPAGADNALTAAAMRAADLCLLPTRPSVADIEASHATVRLLRSFEKPFAFVLNQTAARYQAGEAEPLNRHGVLALPCIVLRNDHQHAVAAGLGVTEFAPNGKAAQEIRSLWAWARQKLESAAVQNQRRTAAAG
jgi:chromosome partitioning protein